MDVQNFLEFAQNLNFVTKNFQNRHFSNFWYKLTKFFKYSMFFIAILVNNFAQNYIRLNSDRPKKNYLLEGLGHGATHSGHHSLTYHLNDQTKNKPVCNDLQLK